MRSFGPALLLLAFAACSYKPAPRDVGKPAYTADLKACQDSAASDVNKRNAKTALAWFSAPVRRWGQISEGVQACMAGKGYGGLRGSSDGELPSGSTSGGLVVTSAGVRCSDPPAPERRRAG